MLSVEKTIKEIQEKRTQKSANIKDETLVMQALLNDHDFKASVYDKNGEVEDYVCPAEDMDSMVSGIISKTTGINSQEADKLAYEYEYTKQDASRMINVSKEFVNTYLETGRKLPLGKRENSDISLLQKIIPAGQRHISKKVGVAEDGSDLRETVYVDVKEHKSIRVISK